MRTPIHLRIERRKEITNKSKPKTSKISEA